jgi:F420H(2)-dependent quinone reductase
MKAGWKLFAGALVAVVALVLVVPNFLPRSVFYRDRKPTKAGMLFVRGFAAWSALGLPPSFSVTLEVTGRVSGKTYSIPLVVADYEGQRYLVSMMGNDVAWVRNVRAGGGQATIRHGGRRPVVLEDVPVELRAPILKAYLRRARGARPHMVVAHDAPLEEFERVADRYPVFRVTEPAAE